MRLGKNTTITVSKMYGHVIFVVLCVMSQN